MNFKTASGNTVILMNGNVGIGTNTPSSKLAVNGDIHAKEVKVDATGWPDYVFGTDYDLPKLDSIAAYIYRNGHLAGMPTSADVHEKGVLLGDM